MWKNCDNPDLYEILMDVNCLISKDLETDSIYDGAGDFCRNLKLKRNIYIIVKILRWNL